MTEYDPFDARLAEALRDYAAEAPTEVEPIGLAHSIATAHPRRRRLAIALGSAQRPSVLVWLLLGAALILGSLVALAAAGALRTREDRQAVPINELTGDWQSAVAAAGPAVPAGIYTLNVNAPALLSRVEGPVAWAGRAARFDPLGPDAWELVVTSSGPCGDGRYTVRRYGVDGVRFTDPIDACVDRVAILVGAPVWQRPEARVPLESGAAYGSWAFTEPFHFVMPAIDAVMKPDEQHGVVHIQHGCCWVMTFLDDVGVNLDPCDSTLALPDIPATPEDVGNWLRSSPGTVVSDPVEIQVDGRTALRFDVQRTTTPCHQPGTPVQVPYQMLGDGVSSTSRVFAIPTGDDTILLMTWADAGSRPDVERAADEIVRSMTFD